MLVRLIHVYPLVPKDLSTFHFRLLDFCPGLEEIYMLFYMSVHALSELGLVLMAGYFSEVLRRRRCVSSVGASFSESCMPRLRDSVLVEIIEAVFVLTPYLIYDGRFVFWYIWQVW